MLRQRGHRPTTYDQMVAELQLDSDEDERETKYNEPWRDPRKYDARESCRRSTVLSEEKRKVDEPCEAKTIEVESKDSEARKRRLSFPRANDKVSSRRGSSSFSRSHNSEGDVPNDSDDSDQEHEAPVINASRELFGSMKTDLSDREISGSSGRAEVNALRSFVMRSPTQGSTAIRVRPRLLGHAVKNINSGVDFAVVIVSSVTLSEIVKASTACILSFVCSLSPGNSFCCARKSERAARHRTTCSRWSKTRQIDAAISSLENYAEIGYVLVHYSFIRPSISHFLHAARIQSGSEYTVYDDGMSPSKTALEASVRNVLGAVEFSYDEMGPGRLGVQIPQVQAGAAATWKDKLEASGGDSDQQLVLRNKRPHFDEKTGGHVLDFGGRVNMPSVKNFQMMCDALGDDTVLQFGRVSCQPPGPRVQCKCHQNTFTMDVKYPLSPLQGFAICLATLDTKFTDLKLYDNVSKLMKRK